jgi:hypothetical protein
MDVGGYYNTGTPCSTCASFAARGTNTGQPFPYTVPQKSWDHNAASASYNALLASLARQFNTGFGYTIAYNWSKTLDEGGDGYFGVEGGVPEDHTIRRAAAVLQASIFRRYSRPMRFISFPLAQASGSQLEIGLHIMLSATGR